MGRLDHLGDAVRRLAAVAEDAGLHGAGKLSDIAGREAGGTLEDWDRARRAVVAKSPHTMAFMADPVAVAAAQYPPALRHEAVAIAADEGFQNVSPGQRVIVLAHPTRNALFFPGSWNAAGYAHYRPRANRAGMIELAAGAKMQEGELEAALAHEARHMLEQPDLGAALAPLDDAYEQNMGLFRSRGRFPSARFAYLSSPGEEMARLGDLRARYASATGRLISNADEAEEAMQMMSRAQGGVGGGFSGEDRQFYMTGRQGSDAIRERQDWLLQKLLSIAPAAAMSGGSEE